MALRSFGACSLAACVLCLLSVAVLARNVEVDNDVAFYDAVCDDTVTNITFVTNFTLYTEHWIRPLPCNVSRDLTMGSNPNGPYCVVDFNYVSNKAIIARNKSVHLEYFECQRFRMASGGQIDFFGYSPGGFIYTKDFNKNAYMCVLPDLAKLQFAIPDIPQFDGWVQNISILPVFCQGSQCWNNVIGYEEFATFVDYSDSDTGGYYMAKENSWKTCEAFLDPTCIALYGASQCFTDGLGGPTPAPDASDDGGVNLGLAVALPVCLGAAAAVILIAAVWLWRRKARARAGDNHRTKTLDESGEATSKLSSSNQEVVTLSGVVEDGSVCTVDIGAPLGQGSFGAVFKGVWQNNPVAVKVIVHGKSAEEQVSNEVKLMTALRHPNVLRAFHCLRKAHVVAPGSCTNTSMEPSVERMLQSLTKSSEQGRPVNEEQVETWIIEEFCDKGPFSSVAYVPRSMAAELFAVLPLLRGVAHGMAYLQSQNVVHGDLKCANVLLQSDPKDEKKYVAKVADFGLSRALKDGATHHSTHTVGTITHMPPELLKHGKLSPAGDVYAFGIMMWEAAAGTTAYRGLLYGEVVERVVVSNQRPEFPEFVPDAYKQLASECWAVDMKDRPEFDQVVERLERLLEQTDLWGLTSGAVYVPMPDLAFMSDHKTQLTKDSAKTGSSLTQDSILHGSNRSSLASEAEVRIEVAGSN